MRKPEMMEAFRQAFIAANRQHPQWCNTLKVHSLRGNWVMVSYVKNDNEIIYKIEVQSLYDNSKILKHRAEYPHYYLPILDEDGKTIGYRFNPKAGCKEYHLK